MSFRRAGDSLLDSYHDQPLLRIFHPRRRTQWNSVELSSGTQRRKIVLNSHLVLALTMHKVR